MKNDYLDYYRVMRILSTDKGVISISNKYFKTRKCKRIRSIVETLIINKVIKVNALYELGKKLSIFTFKGVKTYSLLKKINTYGVLPDIKQSNFIINLSDIIKPGTIDNKYLRKRKDLFYKTIDINNNRLLLSKLIELNILRFKGNINKVKTVDIDDIIYTKEFAVYIKTYMSLDSMCLVF